MIVAITKLDDVMDRSTKVIELNLVDENGAAVIPETAAFTLTDGNYTIINGRENVAIIPLDSSLAVILSGNDLIAGETENERIRYLVIKTTYNSATYGNNLPHNNACTFGIIDLPQT